MWLLPHDHVGVPVPTERLFVIRGLGTSLASDVPCQFPVKTVFSERFLSACRKTNKHRGGYGVEVTQRVVVPLSRVRFPLATPQKSFEESRDFCIARYLSKDMISLNVSVNGRFASMTCWYAPEVSFPSLKNTSNFSSVILIG